MNDEIVIDDDSELGKRPRWYIVHTYSGFEQRVQKTINEMIRSGQGRDLILQCVVPTEKVIELSKQGSKRTTTRKFYPGYVMVQMIMTEYAWNLIQSIPKVTGFVGGKNRPTPMKDSEAENILALMETRKESPRPKFSFDKGEEVRIIDGPFSGFNGRSQLRQGKAARLRFHFRTSDAGGTGFRPGFQRLSSFRVPSPCKGS